MQFHLYNDTIKYIKYSSDSHNPYALTPLRPYAFTPLRLSNSINNSNHLGKMNKELTYLWIRFQKT
jgi:hypothetical protein